MSVHACGAFVREEAQRLLKSLTPDDVRELHQLLKGLTASAWRAVRDEIAPGVALFLSATATQRRRDKYMTRNRLPLTLAAYHACLDAGHFFDVLLTTQQNSAPYRIAVAQIADAYRFRLPPASALWPFEDVPSPFV